MKRILCLFLLFIIVTSGCAYFNAFYLAKRSFRDGEYERNLNNGETNTKATNKYKAAIKWAREVIEKYPESSYIDDSVFIIGKSYYHNLDYVNARTNFENLIKNYPESDYVDEARFFRARCFIGLESYESARLILNELLKTDDRSMKGRAGLALAKISLTTEEWVELLAGAEAVIDADPEKKEHAQAIMYKGEALFNLEKFEDCVTVLIELDRFNIEPELRFTANSRIAQSKAKLGQFDEGLIFLTDIQNKGVFAPFMPRIRLELGTIYELQEDYDTAIDTYKKLAGDFPDSLAAKDASFRVGRLLLRDLANATDAKVEFLKVKDPPQSFRGTYFVEAKLRIAQIDSMDARLKRIEDLDEDVDERTKTRFSLAELYNFSFNRPDSALTQYRLIIEDLPESEYAVMSDFFIQRQELLDGGDFTTESERDMITAVIDEYPTSEFAGKLRVYLGIADSTPHVAALRAAEEALFSGVDWEEYIPLYQAVVDSFPETRSSYQARLVLAHSYEHEAGDSETALEYYDGLANEEPTFFSQEYVETAREKLTYLKEEPKLLDEIKTYLADYQSRKDSGFSETPEGMADGDLSGSGATGYTGLRRIRARNARIRSRYFTD